jgi:hypothetical protein
MLINMARELAQEASFQEAIRIYNKAMALKPAGLEVTPEIRQLQTDLLAQNAAVDLTLTSDGETWVSITNNRAPEKFSVRTVKLLPGNYEIVGRRKGYRDEIVPVQVRAGVTLRPIHVACTVSLQN